jgi:hypothetical protein
MRTAQPGRGWHPSISIRSEHESIRAACVSESRSVVLIGQIGSDPFNGKAFGVNADDSALNVVTPTGRR